MNIINTEVSALRTGPLASSRVPGKVMAEIIKLTSADKPWKPSASDVGVINDSLGAALKSKGVLWEPEARNLVAASVGQSSCDLDLLDAVGEKKEPFFHQPKAGDYAAGGDGFTLISVAHGLLKLEQLGLPFKWCSVLDVALNYIRDTKGRAGLLSSKELSLTWAKACRDKKEGASMIACPVSELAEPVTSRVWVSTSGYTMVLNALDFDGVVTLKAYSKQAAKERDLINYYTEYFSEEDDCVF